MAAGKCGCAGTTCSCVIKGDGVTGAGSVTNPYIITAGVVLQAIPTATINPTLLGDGSPSNPWRLSAVATLDFGDLQDVDASVTTVGYVPARQADGTFAMVPPSTAPVGAISGGNSIEGDGSGGDPLDVRLDSLAGLAINPGGLALSPYTVASEGDLDDDFGALPVGAIVSDTDGTGVWLKTTSGWAVIAEDSGIVSTVSGNIVAEPGWVVDALQMRRRNGMVQLRVTVHRTTSLTTAFETGDIANIDIATVMPSEFRPSINKAMRIEAAGADHSFYITTGGVIRLTNLAQPDVVWAAGDQMTFSGSYIGA